MVVGGDFNAYYHEVSREMLDRGYSEVFKDAQTFKRSTNQLDGIFTNLPVRRKDIKEVGYSDHHLLKVEVMIPCGKNYKVPHAKRAPPPP